MRKQTKREFELLREAHGEEGSLADGDVGGPMPSRPSESDG
jgi:hypothetical protein